MRDIIKASEEFDAPAVERLLREKPDLDGAKLSDHLVTICNWEDERTVDLVKVFLKDSRVDPTFEESACLQLATEANNVAVAQLLLADGRADPCARNSEGLTMASSNGLLNMVRAILSDKRAKPSPDALVQALFFMAEGTGSSSDEDYLGVIKALLEDGRIEVTDEAIAKAREVKDTTALELLTAYKSSQGR
jgi:hypothetical protein